MEKKDVILIAILFAVIGVSLYRKYVKKNVPGRTDQKANKPQSTLSSVKDDDYEPYSKK